MKLIISVVMFGAGVLVGSSWQPVRVPDAPVVERRVTPSAPTREWMFDKERVTKLDVPAKRVETALDRPAYGRSGK